MEFVPSCETKGNYGITIIIWNVHMNFEWSFYRFQKGIGIINNPSLQTRQLTLYLTFLFWNFNKNVFVIRNDICYIIQIVPSHVKYLIERKNLPPKHPILVSKLDNSFVFKLPGSFLSKCSFPTAYNIANLILLSQTVIYVFLNWIVAKYCKSRQFNPPAADIHV